MGQIPILLLAHKLAHVGPLHDIHVAPNVEAQMLNAWWMSKSTG